MMRKRRFQNKAAASSATLPLCAITTVLLWCLGGSYTAPLLWGWAACAIITYLWAETSNTFSLIRIRTMLTPALYALLAGVAFHLHAFSYSTVVTLCIILSYNSLFRSYQRHDASVPVFHAFLCLSLGSLFLAPLLYFVPFYLWYCIAYLRSLHWRTLWAAILGLVLPYWLVGGYQVAFGSLQWFTAHWNALIPTWPHHPDSYLAAGYPALSLTALVLVVSFIASVHAIRTSFNDKIRVRMYTYVLLSQQLLIVLFMALQPQHFKPLSSLLYMNSAPLLAHYFALTSHRLTNLLFVLTLIMLAITALMYLWN